MTGDHAASIAEPVSTPVYRVALPTGDTYLTADVELVTEPVYRLGMPNGQPCIVEPPGCAHCRPRAHQAGRSKSRALVVWLCSGGCGFHPIHGTPIGGAS